MERKRFIWVVFLLLATCYVVVFVGSPFWSRSQRELHRDTIPEFGAATGKVFSGKRIRKWGGGDDFDSSESSRQPIISAFSQLPSIACDSSYWAVLTTISCPTLAVQTILAFTKACVVLIGDRKGPHDADHCVSELTVGGRVLFLSSTLQEQVGISSRFLSGLPWNSYARKNIGYLYAMWRGAIQIWDFDDDNVLREGTDPFSLMPTLPAQWVLEGTADVFGAHVFNPYPEMGCPYTPCWPRGYPLAAIRMPSAHVLKHLVQSSRRIGVWQSLANKDPDVDAIYRLVQPLPIEFPSDDLQKTIGVSRGIFAPYNAQATLHSSGVFWGLYLPTTVNGRVADIWRSYFTQALFWDCGYAVAFTPPLVTQDRNVHDYQADFDAEAHLYKRTEKLLFRLAESQLGRDKENVDLAERAKALWVDMYEHGYIEREDVELVFLWWNALSEIGVGTACTSDATPSAITSPSDPVVGITSASPSAAVAIPPDLVAGTADANPSAAIDSPPSPSSSAAAAPSAITSPPDPVVGITSASPSAAVAIPPDLVAGTAGANPSAAIDSPSSPSSSAAATALSSGFGERILRFWQGDVHDGPRVDVPSLLMKDGHRFYSASHKGAMGPVPWIFKHPGMTLLRRQVDSSENLQISDVITGHDSHSMPLHEQQIKTLFSFYQSNEERRNLIREVDAFICTFPASFCEAYMPFNRSIIWLPAHRITLGRCTKESFQRLLDHVRESSKPKKGRPRHIVAAMSHYDLEYVRYFTGVTPILLESSAMSYIPPIPVFNPSKEEILVGPLQLKGVPEQLKTVKSAFKFITAKEVYGQYELTDLCNHRAVVLFPYAMMSYGITELYALAIPMFVPTIEFALKLNLGWDAWTSSEIYCKETLEAILPTEESKIHPFSPESKSKPARSYWYKFADYYMWPHIVQFGSIQELLLRLEHAQFKEIHEKMMQANQERLRVLKENWKIVISKIDRNKRVLPTDYDRAISQLWGPGPLMTS